MVNLTKAYTEFLKKFSMRLIAITLLGAPIFADTNLQIVYHHNGPDKGIEAPYMNVDVPGSMNGTIDKIKVMLFDDTNGQGQQTFFTMLQKQGVDVSGQPGAKDAWPKNQVLAALQWTGSKALGLTEKVVDKAIDFFEVSVKEGLIGLTFQVADALLGTAANVLDKIYTNGIEKHYVLDEDSLKHADSSKKSTSFKIPSNVKKVFMAVVQDGDNGEILGQWNLPNSAVPKLDYKFGISTLPVRTILSQGLQQISGYKDKTPGGWQTINAQNLSSNKSILPRVDWQHSAFLTIWD